jgi:hypothetical protein
MQRRKIISNSEHKAAIPTSFLLMITLPTYKQMFKISIVGTLASRVANPNRMEATNRANHRFCD